MLGLGPLAALAVTGGIITTVANLASDKKYVRSFPTLSCHVNISDLRSHLSSQ
jgi:hypothetical protein